MSDSLPKETGRDDAPFDCPACGEPTEVLVEGYCEECRDERQRELDEHNASYDRWQGMTDAQRDAEIRGAWRGL